MRILLTGVTGQLGYDTYNELTARGHEVVGTGTGPESPIPGKYIPMQLADPQSIRDAFREAAAQAVIHCASWTAVDDAQKPENRDRVRAVNVEGTRTLAQCCREADIPMMYISTDYVFDGSGTEPNPADSENFGPCNFYGETKLAAERIVRDLLGKYFIVRVSWTYGVHGKNFVKTMLKLAQTHDTLRVVDDQVGTPTATQDIAALLAQMIVTDKYGCYNATNSGGYISWYEFACEIFRQAGQKVTVVPVSTQEYGMSLARRPLNSRLDCRKLTEKGFAALPRWKDALGRFLEELEGQSTTE